MNTSGSGTASGVSDAAAGSGLHRNAACILGIPIDSLTLDDVGRKIDSSVRTGQRLFISTVNLNFLTLCRSSDAFRSSLRASDICTADGMAVVALCRFLGIAVPERVAGSDFVSSLAKRAAPRPHVKVFFFGGAENAGARACSAVDGLGSPVLSCCGHLNPGFGGIEDLSNAAKLDEINASHADFLVVSLGAEKGQSWIVRNLGRIGPPVVSHLGASINFLAGTVQRAPGALQKSGLEWLWRIYQEPHLFARYAKDAATLAGLMLTAIIPLRVWLSIGKWKYGTAGLGITQTGGGSGHACLKLQGALTRGATAKLATAFTDAMTSASSISLDLGQVSWLDPYGAGCLLVMTEAARLRGIAVTAVGAPRFVQTGLKLFGLTDLMAEGGSEDLRVPPQTNKELAYRALDAVEYPAGTLAGPKN